MQSDKDNNYTGLEGHSVQIGCRQKHRLGVFGIYEKVVLKSTL